ncbi:MAG: Hsp20/alpha crystallin family protein [Candidatus Scalindua sp.]|nr:Hsp20/alpha crystallin family protein [Candidatus Scalindua sp.]
MTRALTRWAFQDEINRMVDNFIKRETVFGVGWSPDVDVAENDNDIIVKAEIPGIDPKDIDISITGDTLTIKGEKKESKKEKSKSYHHIERSYGSFSRTINLPTRVITDKVAAKNNHGVLEITLPKKEESRTKKIAVKVV